MLFTGSNAIAQRNEVWLTAQGNFRFSKYWGMTADVNHRWLNLNGWQSAISGFRAGATYFVTGTKQLTAGYAWFGAHTYGAPNTILAENRLWQQYLVNHQTKKISHFSRLRLEQRFHEAPAATNKKNYYSTRLRYMHSLSLPIIRSKKNNQPVCQWIAADEIMLHAGERIGNHFFDQNRLITGLELHPAKNLAIVALYQYTSAYQLTNETVAAKNIYRLTTVFNLQHQHPASLAYGD